MNQVEAPHQAIIIMINARFFVLLLKYLNGEVIDQYRSRDKMLKLKIEAVEAV